MKLYKKICLTVALLLGLSGVGIVVTGNGVLLAATAQEQVCIGANGGDTSKTCDGDSDIQRVLKVVLNVMSWIAGLIATIMLIIAGIKFATSGGSSEKAKTAQSTIIYAMVGIVIVALSQIIVHFVLNQVGP